MLNNKEVVNKLLDVVRAKLQVGAGVAAPSAELTLLTAKELNLVMGKRGRDGGTFPTDTGLETLGLDVSKFRTEETVARELVKANRPKTVRVVVARDADTDVVVTEAESV